MNFDIPDDEKITTVNENIQLIQKKQGLTFGTDAYLLAAYIKEQKNATALELGGGTGIISLLCASRKKFKKIYCAEIQKSFCELIEKNTDINGFDNIECLNTDIRDLKPEVLGKEIDVVFSNPPYMQATSGKRNASDEKNIARHEVCGGIFDFCRCASRMLKHGGLFYCVFRPDRLADLICALRENKLEPKELVTVCANTAAKPSMVLIKAKKGASPSLIMSEPLFLNLDENPKELTERAKQIYESCNF